MARLEQNFMKRFDYLLSLNVNGMLTQPRMLEELLKLAKILRKKPYR